MEDDLDLLSRYHRHGDAEAFRSLVEAHAGMVHSTASRVTCDSMLAQDVAQETFLALARASGAAIQSVGAWLHHVAWQKARDAVRKESRRRNNEAAAAERLHESHEEATWAGLEPFLDEALDDLPQQVKAMLIARYFEGRTQQEIAKNFRVSQSTVSRTLEQGITALRSKLKTRGVLCGAGLATLLTANGGQAAPPALMATLGKIGLTGVGAATSLTLVESVIAALASPLAKIALATAAALGVVALGSHFVSGGARDERQGSARVAGAILVPSGGKASLPANLAASPPSRSSRSPAAVSEPPPSIKGPSPALVAKLVTFKRSEDFKAFVLRLFASKDPARIAAELQQQMDVSFNPKVLAKYLSHPNLLEMAIAAQLAIEHPEEALAWLAMFEGSSNMISQSIYRQIFDRYPHITAESIAATLPEGNHREHVLGMFRSQRDPITETAREMTASQDARVRQDHFWQLADQWPKAKEVEGIRWGVAHLQGDEFNAFVPRLLGRFSIAQPDETLRLMSQITNAKQLQLCMSESLSGIVSTHHRPGDLLPLIDRLQGEERRFAVSRLASAWVQADQGSLVQWLNTIETPADFDAALPTILPRLSEEHYQRAMSALMTQLDTGLEAALIRTAMPSLSPGTRSAFTSMDIINSLTALPQHHQIGSGMTGNQELLWQAMNQNAASWVSRQGAAPVEAARWIDSLPFRSATDKAVVAEKLYRQWKLSDPGAAAGWARSAGVVVK